MQNLEAEMSVLGAILQDGAALSEVIQTIEPLDFDRSAHRLIFEAMCEMGEGIDQLTLSEHLQGKGKLKPAGGASYLARLTDATPTTANIGHYARIVRSNGIARRLSATFRQSDQRLHRGDSPADVAADISQMVLEAACANGNGHKDKDALSAAFEQVQRYQEGEAAGCLQTGFYNLAPYDPEPDQFVVVAGRPSIGKTALAAAIAEQIACRNTPILFCSIEMSAEAVSLRRLAAEMGIPMRDFRRRGAITNWDSVTEAADACKRRPFHLVSGRSTPPEIIAAIRQAKIRHDIKAAFVDHLGLVKMPKDERRDLAIGQVTSNLARLSKELQLVIFLCSQLNRTPESRDGHKPRLADLRDSGRIEEDADAVWLIHRESYYRKDADDTFEITIAKNRNGPIGTACLTADMETGRFKDKGE